MDLGSRFDPVEDVHICGACRTQFNNVDVFLRHKQQECPVLLALCGERQTPQVTGQSQNTGNTSVASVTSEVKAIYGEKQIYVPAAARDVIQQPQSHDYIHSESHHQSIEQSQLPVGYTSTPEGHIVIENDGQYMPLSHVVMEQTASREFVSMEMDNQQEYVLQPCTQQNGDYRSTQELPDMHQDIPPETIYTLESIVHPGIPQVNQLMQLKPVTQTVDVSSANESAGQVTVVQSAGYYTNTSSSSVPPSMPMSNYQVSQPSDNVSSEAFVHSEARVQDEYVTSTENPGQLVHYTLGLEHTEIPQNPSVSTKLMESKSNNPNSGIQTISTSSRKPKKMKKLETQNDGSIDQSADVSLQNVYVQYSSNGDAMLKVAQSDMKSSARAKPGTASQVNDKTAPGGKPPPEKRFKCPECSYRTSFSKDLERHHRTHSGERPYSCAQCGKTFTRNDKLLLHMRYHAGDKAFKCQLCNYKAVESGSLKKHMLTHTDIRPFQCQVCPYSARTAAQLQVHLRIHTGDTPYACSLCTATFKVTSDLKRHMRVHTGEKPYQCDLCEYKCAFKGNLLSHRRASHDALNLMTCEVCHFKCSSKKKFREHMKSHDVNDELRCDVCNYQCSTKSALKNHSLIHEGKSFPCPHCVYSSKQCGNLNAHIRRRHPAKCFGVLHDKVQIAPSLATGKSPKMETSKHAKAKCQQNFKCHLCDAAFVREDSLKCHVKHHNYGASLSTAYAVLKLQQPVINSTSQHDTNKPDNTPAVADDDIIDVDSILDQDQILLPEPTAPKEPSQPAHVDGQGPVLQGQAVSLGINDILAAAGIATFPSPSKGTPPPFPTSSIGITGTDTIQKDSSYLSKSAPLASVSELLAPLAVAQNPQEVPSLQVMQNISLPYIRLPNGQVLILTGQNPLGQLVTQTDVPANSDKPAQIFGQHPIQELQVMQISPPPVTPQLTQLPSPVQQGAIPIQIILPNESQQALPIVSQILSSVMNQTANVPANTAEAGQQIPLNSDLNSKTHAEALQNFVVQIPANANKNKITGSPTESQSFVLQIPGPSNQGNIPANSDVQHNLTVQVHVPGQDVHDNTAVVGSSTGAHLASPKKELTQDLSSNEIGVPSGGLDGVSSSRSSQSKAPNVYEGDIVDSTCPSPEQVPDHT